MSMATPTTQPWPKPPIEGCLTDSCQGSKRLGYLVFRHGVALFYAVWGAAMGLS